MSAVSGAEWAEVAARTFILEPDHGPQFTEIRAAFPGRSTAEIAAGLTEYLQANGVAEPGRRLFMHNEHHHALNVLLGGRVTLLQDYRASEGLSVPGLLSNLTRQRLIEAAEIEEAESLGMTLEQFRAQALGARQDPPAPAPPTTPTPPAPPARPPASQPPPGGGQQGRQIDIDFSKAEAFPVPRGATEVRFFGTLELPATLPLGIKPLLGIALGATEGERAKVGLLKITRDQRFGIEWDPDRTKPAGGARAQPGSSIAISYWWTPGRVRLKIGDAGQRGWNTVPGGAPEGGVIVFGVNPPKPDSDKPAEYVRLLGGRLRGVLAFTGGASQPGPVAPPVDPLPPVDGNLRAMAAEVAAKTQDATSAAQALLAAIERSGS